MAGSGGRSKRKGGPSRGGGGGAGGANGGTGAGELVCPETLTTMLVGPAAGACSVGDILNVVTLTTPSPARVVCVHPATGATVGSIGGIPHLSRLLACLAAGVIYEAIVDAVVGGRVDVTVRKV